MEHATVSGGHSLKNYLIGFVLAVILTAIPFALVAMGALPRVTMFFVIAVAAVVQVFVHLRYFLNLSLKETPRENILALAFACVLVFLMVGGTMWIMFNLDYRHDM